MFRKLFGSGKEKAPVTPPRDVDVLTAALAVPALHLRVSDRSSKSHFGGTPEVPEGFSWPTRDGRQLDFLVAINLSEMRAALAIEWLPSSGTLLFFYDAQEQPWGFDPKDRGGWAVILVPVDMSMPKPFSPSLVLKQKGIEFIQIKKLPSWERPEIQALKLTDEESEQFGELADREYAGLAHHQIGGYPDPVQGDHMELESQLVSNGIYCGDAKGYKSARAKELEGGAAEWRLLLQLDSDDGLDVMWGDVGKLYFWIRESDARSGIFSNVWLVQQCH